MISPDLRCMFCGKKGFENLDQTSKHTYGLKPNGMPSCSAIPIEFIINSYKTDKWFGADGQYYRDTGKYVSEQSVKNYLMINTKKNTNKS